ncbi:Leucine Rich repeats (2 copies) [Stieleria maiorica]|uniref:Leucine Rich repeats (2 copies) n=1 Tax=Stieleria maiorica TaxID=2795974 RepID=A0A5B9ML12_9BACT|nr:hypothetical protein [Stieleria maiorica]QEG00711.1 Leucine Rich repeats (2 copies) [Stieleria maiorica]
MNHWLRSIAALVALSTSGWVGSVSWAQSGPQAPAAESDSPAHSTAAPITDAMTFDAAIAELSHARFARRQAAYRFLIESGSDAIARLENTAGSADRNVAERCVRALVEITRDSECTEAALAALDRLAEDASNPVADLAASESRRLKMSKEEHAIEALIAAGVDVHRSTRGTVYTIQIARDQDLFWLKFLPQLRRVRLSGNGITDAGLKHLFDCNRLSDLSFSRTAVTDAGLGQLRHLPSLSGLHLGDDSFTADGIRKLKSIPGLTSLSWFASIDRERLQAIGELQNLTSFSFSTQQVTEETIQIINQLSQLTHLHLTATGVTDLQCRYLGRIKPATNLSLMQSPELTLAGWEQLCRLDLQTLSTYQTPITDEVLQRLGDVTSLKYLTVTEAPISDDGLLHLKKLSELRYVNLRRTNVTQEGADRLKKLLPKLRTLRIDSQGFAAAEPYSITTAGGKKNVHLRIALTDATLKTLAREKDIHTVYMNRIGSNDQQVRMIATLPIKGLVIDSDAVTDQGLAALKEHPHLELLTVTSNRLTDGCKDTLLAIPKLSKLWIQKATLTDDGVGSLVRGFCDKQQLTSLTFGNCPQITNAAFDGIIKLTSLSYLALRDNPRLDSAVFRHLHGMEELVEIRLEGNTVRADDLKHLGTLPLERLHLSNSTIAEGAMAALADASPKIRQLGLAKSNVDDIAMASIGKLEQLEWLWLYGTSVSDDGLTELDDLNKLKHVYVDANHVTAKGQQRFEQQHPDAVLRRY